MSSSSSSTVEATDFFNVTPRLDEVDVEEDEEGSGTEEDEDALLWTLPPPSDSDRTNLEIAMSDSPHSLAAASNIDNCVSRWHLIAIILKAFSEANGVSFGKVMEMTLEEDVTGFTGGDIKEFPFFSE
jgi:hypothetical protein